MTNPTKEQVITLFRTILEQPKEIQHTMPNVGAFLGLKWIDSFMPPIVGVPEWDYNAMCEFCRKHGLESTDSIQEALDKLLRE